MKLKLQWDTVFSLMPSNVDKMLPSTLWLEGVAMDRAPIPNTIMYQPEFGQEKGTHTKVLQQEGISCRQWKTYKTVGKSKGQGSFWSVWESKESRSCGEPHCRSELCTNGLCRKPHLKTTDRLTQPSWKPTCHTLADINFFYRASELHTSGLVGRQ